MRGRVPTLDQIVELRIDADAVVADQQAGRHIRVICHQAADERDHRVTRFGDAEDDLVIRVVEGEGRGQRFLDIVFDAAGRTQDGHWRALVRGAGSDAARTGQQHRNPTEMNQCGYSHGSENQDLENHCGGQCQ